jgi:uroporphyrinogen-III decarboxylase
MRIWASVFTCRGFFPFDTHYEGVDVKVEVQGDVTTTSYKTPNGVLTERWKYLKDTFSESPMEHLVKGLDDLPALRYLYEHTYYEPNYSKAVLFRQYVGDNGVTLCYMPKSPFMELVALKAGIENLTYCIADDEEEVSHTLEVMQKKHEEAAILTLEAGTDCVMIPENLSSESVGKGYFHRYMEPYHKKWTAEIKKRGKVSFIHMDGTLKGLLAEVSRAGFRVLEALTPAPVGDVPLKDFLPMVSEDVIVWGGLPGAFFSDFVSDEVFDRYVIDTIKYMRSAPHRFVLGVADQVPPYTRPERIRRVNELVEEYGAYSC